MGWLAKLRNAPKERDEYLYEMQKYKHLAEYFEKKYHKVNHLYKHFKTQFAPGHFYSPYPDLKEIKKRSDSIFDRTKRDIPGIDIREKAQLSLLQKLARQYPSLPYTARKVKSLRYYFGPHAYSYTDATVLFCMLRHFKPKRIVEIGSGYSSALTLDVKEKFLPKLDVTFVEPYPELLLSLCKPGDEQNFTLLDQPLHEVDPSVFEQLQSGDILFIDSTHVAKAGSDVTQIYFDILPRLKSGVIIHIHDIFYPFEYPYEWIKETRAWNEDYIVRAFLYNNPDYQIIFFNHFLNIHHQQTLAKYLPPTKKNIGGSLWLKKR